MVGWVEEWGEGGSQMCEKGACFRCHAKELGLHGAEN